MPSLRNLLFSVLIPGLALSSSLAAAPLRVSGRVLDPRQDSGLTGARVELLPAYEAKTVSAPLASARTDKDGFFEIAAPESGCFRLVVRAEGYLSEEHPLVPLVEDRELSATDLIPAQSLEVRTVGPGGQPVAGVEVRIASLDPLRPVHGDRPLGWRLSARTGVSGPDGKVVLPIHERETPEVIALSPKFLEQHVTVSPPSATLRLSPVREAGSPARPSPPRRISGTVTDAVTGRPVPGALVWSGWPLVAPAVHADGEGRFQIDVPAGEEIWLEAAAADFLPGERQPAKQGAAGPVLVKLHPAAEISGVVVDSAGQPVAKAWIQLDPPRAIDQGLDFSGVRGRADGRFRLTGLKPGGLYKLTARREGFERTSVTARTSLIGRPSPPPVRIVLGEGKTAFGRVVDAADRPVAGVKLVLFDQVTYGDQQEAETNEEGRFDIRHLSPGTYTLMLLRPDRAGLKMPLEMPAVEIPPTAPTVNLGDLKLPAEGAIEGRVTDTRGKPIEGVEVHVAEAPDLESGSLNLGEGAGDAQRLPSYRTGPDGSFRAEELESGDRFDLHLKHPDYAETTVAGIEVPTKEPVRIEMKAGHRLAGQVVDTEGKPVAGASLTWIERSEGIAGLIGSQRPLGVTDAEGRFQVRGLPAGSLDLEVSAEGYQTRWMDSLSIPEDRDLEEMKVVLGRGSWLDVQVRDAEGKPVSGAILFAHPQDLLKEQSPRALLLRAFSDCQTDSQGRCRLSLPEPGSYRVQLSPKDLTVDVTAAPGGTPVEIRLPRGFEVSGRVVGKDGGGVPAVYIQARSDTQESSAARSDADGTFVFRGLPDGRYHLSVRQPGEGEASLEVEVAGQPVRGLELRLSATEPTAALTGRLTGVLPEELTGAVVQAESPDAGSKSGRVERDGRYQIPDLEPGAWTISARTGSGRRAEGRIQIEAGVTAATLDLDFAAGLTLSGRVLVDGSPVSGANVLAGNRDTRVSGRLSRTSYDGSFTLRDLPSGPLSLLVVGSPGISAIRTVQLEESGEITIEITTGTFKATVLSATGEPLEGAVATLEPWDPEIQIPFAAASARSGPDGALDAGRLAPGTYLLEIRKEGFQPRQEKVEIRPGGAAVLEVRLRVKE